MAGASREKLPGPAWGPAEKNGRGAAGRAVMHPTVHTGKRYRKAFDVSKGFQKAFEMVSKGFRKAIERLSNRFRKSLSRVTVSFRVTLESFLYPFERFSKGYQKLLRTVSKGFRKGAGTM